MVQGAEDGARATTEIWALTRGSVIAPPPLINRAAIARHWANSGNARSAPAQVHSRASRLAQANSPSNGALANSRPIPLQAVRQLMVRRARRAAAAARETPRTVRAAKAARMTAVPPAAAARATLTTARAAVRATLTTARAARATRLMDR